MFDAFPFDEWSSDVAEFWTFGGESSLGTWIFTILGFGVFLLSMVYYVWLEKRKLDAQAAALRAGGAFGPGQAPPPSA